MKIVVTGASGFVGGALVPWLREHGHEVVRLVRARAQARDEISWDPKTADLDPAKLIGVNAIVHLAGANVAAGRWTDRRKREIMSSRVDGLRTLTAAIRRGSQPPEVLISASATGFYGDRGDEILDESSGPGTGFLVEVCQAWEAGLGDARALGMRTASVRLGVVLGPDGGTLAKMVPVFRLGLGGRLGSGRQWMSWIAMEDLLSVFHQAVTDREFEGVINAVSPDAVTNADFTRSLARVVRRPAVLPVPSFVLRGIFGQMADETLLASTRVVPGRLEGWGFRFARPDLAEALAHALADFDRPSK